MARVVDIDFWLVSAHHLARLPSIPFHFDRSSLDQVTPGDTVHFMAMNAPYYAATGLVRPAETGFAEVIDISKAHRRMLVKISSGMVQTHLHKLRSLMVAEIGFDYVTFVTKLRSEDC